MPVYAYKGVNQSGRSTRGFVDAESDRSARAKLRRDGVFLTELVESANREAPAAAGRLPRIQLRRSVSETDLAIATRQLATLIGAGIPLVESLGALAEQVESTRLKGILGRVRDQVNEGASLADALAASGPFSGLYVSMVRAGEAGGALETVLQRLADYLEQQVRTRNKVTATLIYPLVMLGVAGLVVVFLVTVVLPQITQLLESLHQPLPFYTVAIIEISRWTRSWWWLLVLAGIAVSVAFRMVVATTAGRRAWDGLRLRIPVIGKILRTLVIARFTRTLATLLAGGIPIVRALDISRHVAANVVIGQAIEAARDSITEGASIARPLRASGQFPPLVTHMVDVGERTGELDAMLVRVAEAYDEQVENAITRLTALLEPALILVMVGIVFVIILSTLVPLLQLTSAIH